MKVIGSIDNHTRCKHYHTEKDIIAIKFKCCDTYYGCYFCHEENVNHQHTVWHKNEWETKAIFCGDCHEELTIQEYQDCNYKCPKCHADFNPGCKNHYHLYFE
ncbi:MULTISPECIES: CHY zinc finger protein [unclassified Bacillus (in: firmicutes)]|uniref:CHY zinc finger protein n=1 Tax=unclassified Bacillus (in: firmicutes) TaxID=185979 RepID=UPI000BF1FD28|nr:MULTISPECIES: CHY zinc finger protein [unclassified Bacillus (in: firmicutes)]PEJ59167.1 hypothetical protein CN692_06720 [Bacillus sp. AFS002410]PEL14384.1 hypothetical protein CN601_00475 [Bacillus sp. AFS017336]